MPAMQIRDVPDDDREVLVRAAKRRNMSLQKYLAEQLHVIAVQERNRLAIEELGALDQLGGAVTGDELDDMRDASRRAHDEHLAEKSGT